jgi:hypothetical protein
VNAKHRSGGRILSVSKHGALTNSASGAWNNSEAKSGMSTMSIDLRTISDDELHAEYQRREEIERRFVWSITLMREYAVWESESGRARKITEWHARHLAEKLCEVIGISREEFAKRVIDASM